MPLPHTEYAFEVAIEGHLASAGGYVVGVADAFDRDRCLDPAIPGLCPRDTTEGVGVPGGHSEGQGG